MSLKQCSGCQEMVEESKAYCPDCGTPMDEEQKRNGSSEYDSLMKTQNINVTSHLKMIEQFNLSSVFTPPKTTDESGTVKKEPAAAKRETKTIQLQAIPETNTGQPYKTVSNPEKKNNLSSNNNAVSGNEANSKKTLYIVGGIVLLFLALAVAAAVTFGILYWYNK
jgi:hypothetical protein